MRAKCLELGPEQEVLPHPAVIQWLFAEPIPDQAQRMAAAVPQRECEHARTPPERRFQAPMVDCLEQCLDIGMAPPTLLGHAAFAFELLADLGVVVDFAVE